MPKSWQFVPTAVIEDEERRNGAEAWADRQRAAMADEWAARQTQDADEMFSQLAPPPMGYDMPGEAFETPIDSTVSLGQGQKQGGKYQLTLNDIANAAQRAGLDEEGTRVALAIAQTEGGLSGAVGDVQGGGSYGPFQFYWQGQLGNYAKAHGISLQEAANHVQENPLYAAEWGLNNYLGKAIREGQAKGLSGPALATYAQRYGQVSVSPERAGQNYDALFSGQNGNVYDMPFTETPRMAEQRQGFEQNENEWLRQNLPGYAGAGDALGKVGEGLQWAQENVQYPALEAATYLGSRGIEGTDPAEGVQALGQGWKERGEPFLGYKGAIEAVADPLNFVPVTKPFELAGKGIQAARTAAPALKETARAAGRVAIEELAAGIKSSPLIGRQARSIVPGFAEDMGQAAKQPWEVTRETFANPEMQIERLGPDEFVQRWQQTGKGIHYDRKLNKVVFAQEGSTDATLRHEIAHAYSEGTQPISWQSVIYDTPGAQEALREWQRTWKGARGGAWQSKANRWNDDYGDPRNYDWIEHSADMIAAYMEGSLPPALRTVVEQMADAYPETRLLQLMRHRQAVEQALSEGKSIPQEVLNDYPDLAVKYKSITEPLVGKRLTEDAVPFQPLKVKLPGAPESVEELGSGQSLAVQQGLTVPPPKTPPPPPPPKGPSASGRKPRMPEGYTGPTRTAGFAQFWDRARNVIERQGEAGKELGKSLERSRDAAETYAGHLVSGMPTVRKLSKIEFDNFVDVAEGKASAISDKVDQAAREWALVRDDIYNQGRAVGVDIGFQGNYFPHIYDQSRFKGDKWQEAIDHLVRTGQAPDATEAARMLRHAQDVVRNRRYGNLEIQRLTDLPGYKRTPEALFSYIENATNRIAQVNTFGKDDIEAMKLINRIAEEGYDASAAKNLFDISVGAKKYGTLQSEASNKLRHYSVFTKLGLGAISNVQQSVNTASVAGVMRTATAAAKSFKPEEREFALKSGVILDGVLKDLREGLGFEGAIGKIGAPGFNEVEKFNRVVAATAGREWAEDLARQAVNGNKGAIANLNKLGLDGATIAKRKSQSVVPLGQSTPGVLTEGERMLAAREVVKRTQFKVDPQDLPGWASSPMGKLVMQFRSFSYNQSAFMAREIIKPALEGNVAPLVRFVLLGLPVGAAALETKNLLRNRPSEELSEKRALQYFMQVGGMGLVGDIITGLWPMNSQYLDAARARGMAASTLGGPAIGTGLEGWGSTAEAVQGKPTNLERFALRQIPVVGGTLQNTFFPYKPGGRGAKGKSPIEQYREQRGGNNAVEKYRQRKAR